MPYNVLGVDMVLCEDTTYRNGVNGLMSDSWNTRSIQHLCLIFISIDMIFSPPSLVAPPSNQGFPLVVIWTATVSYCSLIGQDGIALMQSSTYYFAAHSRC